MMNSRMRGMVVVPAWQRVGRVDVEASCVANIDVPVRDAPITPAAMHPRLVIPAQDGISH